MARSASSFFRVRVCVCVCVFPDPSHFPVLFSVACVRAAQVPQYLHRVRQEIEEEYQYVADLQQAAVDAERENVRELSSALPFYCFLPSSLSLTHRESASHQRALSSVRPRSGRKAGDPGWAA